MSKIALVYRIWDNVNNRYLSDEEMKRTVITNTGTIAMLVNGEIKDAEPNEHDGDRYLIEYGQRYYDNDGNEFFVYEFDHYIDRDGKRWLYRMPGMLDAFADDPVRSLGSSRLEKE